MKATILTFIMVAIFSLNAKASENVSAPMIYSVELPIYSGRDNPTINITEGELHKSIEESLLTAEYSSSLESIYQQEPSLGQFGYSGFTITVYSATGVEMGKAFVSPDDKLSIELLKYFIIKDLISDKQKTRLRVYIE